MKELVIQLKAKTNAPDLSMKGFKHMASVLSEVTNRTFDPKYLKYNLYEGKSKSKVRESVLDTIAEFLEYKSYRDFIEKMNTDPVLESLVGKYYSYVRMNREKGKVLRSPVEISLKEGHLHYYQKGGRLTYIGEVVKREGCVFVLMRSTEGKSFHHVYRVGSSSSPEVLQGIFSGVSTDFEPIGGRAVLWRSKKSFGSLKTGKLDIAEMQKSKQKEHQLLAAYFRQKESNNLSIKSAYTFGPDDLE